MNHRACRNRALDQQADEQSGSAGGGTDEQMDAEGELQASTGERRPSRRHRNQEPGIEDSCEQETVPGIAQNHAAR